MKMEEKKKLEDMSDIELKAMIFDCQQQISIQQNNIKVLAARLQEKENLIKES